MIYMKILSHDNCMFLVGYVFKNMDFSTRTGFLQYHHGFSIARHTTALNKFMHEDKCCTLGLGCCLNMALFRRLLLDYIPRP